MLDQVTQILWGFLFIVACLGFFFFVLVCWMIREQLSNVFSSLGKVILTVGVAFRKTIKDEYTRDEMIKNIGYFELRGITKSADHWRSELARKYPEEPYNG